MPATKIRAQRKPRNVLPKCPRDCASSGTAISASVVRAADVAPYRYFEDLEAGFHDLLGVRLLMPDQRKALAAMSKFKRVSLRGGNGTGKSYLAGGAALIFAQVYKPSRTMFTGPKFDQIVNLAWAELKRHYRDSVVPFGGQLGRYQWTLEADWFALVYGVPADVDDSQAASKIKGVLHSTHQLAVVEEANGVRQAVMDGIDSALTAVDARKWTLFNPTNANDPAGKFEASLPKDARLVMSAIDCIEWQEKHGVEVPGAASRVWLEEIARPKWEGTPLWDTNVLGQYPDEDAEWVVVPYSWAKRCVNCITEPTQTDRGDRAVGVDTAWGHSSETVFAPRIGRIVGDLKTYHGLKDVPALAGRLMRLVDEIGGAVACIDVVGTAGAGTHDIVKQNGYTVRPIRGGDGAKRKDEYVNRVTELWFNIRNRVRRTIEAMDAGLGPDAYEISLPDNEELLVQLAGRRWTVKGGKRLALESKEDMQKRGLSSPDRADAVAYSLATARSARTVTGTASIDTSESFGSSGSRWGGSGGGDED